MPSARTKTVLGLRTLSASEIDLCETNMELSYLVARCSPRSVPRRPSVLIRLTSIADNRDENLSTAVRVNSLQIYIIWDSARQLVAHAVSLDFDVPLQKLRLTMSTL